MSPINSPARSTSTGSPAPAEESASPVAAAIESARTYLLGLQREDGHWCGELEGDSILESEYILTMAALGRLDEAKVGKAGQYLRENQLPDGGWGTYPGGGADVNPTVKAYFALKLLGDKGGEAHMRAARKVALELGGIDACNSFTRIYLAVFGQYPWSRCPAVPPELILLPRWVPFNIYAFSAWSRAIVVPLSIIRALRPRCDVPMSAAIAELRLSSEPPATARPDSLRGLVWSRLFRLIDGALRIYEKAPLPGLRRRAIERARQWTVAHLQNSDGLGAIFPPIVNSIFALRALGVSPEDPLLAEQVEELERLEIEESGTLRVQPCLSPVWDTALALGALLDSGMEVDSAAARGAVAWLLDREVRGYGDWSLNCPGTAPGGWYFEYANEFYPDCDDTAQVMTSLARFRSGSTDGGRVDEALRRARSWLEGMQNRDGGWGAFDKGCDREFLTFIPFADHNAMIDPATVDVTARVVQALLRNGTPADSPRLQRALEFLMRRQESDGSWYGRWGCNYLYGTWLAVAALHDSADQRAAHAIGRAAHWLESCQNLDGGWGESPRSYVDPASKGEGPSTACQTSWALLGLMAAGREHGTAVQRGVEYLLAGQESNGGWHDEHWTGTGFPEVFYLRYDLYATYFPLMALSTYHGADGVRSI